MKRKTAFLLVLIMVFAITNAGSEGIREWFLQSETAMATATPAPNAFRFQTEPMTERSMQNWSVMFSDGKVVVSRFTADLIFMFREDRLLMSSYEFQDGTENAFIYLSGALCFLYGDKADAEPLKIKSLMDAINPGRYRIDRIKQASQWETGDGTAIYLYYYSQKDFAITYVSPELGNSIFQTNGL